MGDKADWQEVIHQAGYLAYLMHLQVLHSSQSHQFPSLLMFWGCQSSHYQLILLKTNEHCLVNGFHTLGSIGKAEQVPHSSYSHSFSTSSEKELLHLFL